MVVRTSNGRKVVQHGGGIDGFNTFLAYYPDTRVTVAVLANINGESPNQISTKLADLAHGGAVQLTSERKEIPLPVATLSKYVGTYEVAPGVNMLIRLEGDGLTTQLPGQRQFPIFAESQTKFFLKAVEAQVEFFMDANGTVTHAVMYQNGRERRVPRTGATVVAPESSSATGTAAAQKLFSEYRHTFHWWALCEALEDPLESLRRQSERPYLDLLVLDPLARVVRLQLDAAGLEILQALVLEHVSPLMRTRQRRSLHDQLQQEPLLGFDPR